MILLNLAPVPLVVVIGEGEVVEDVADILARVEAVLVAEGYGGEGDIGHGLGEALDDGDAGLQLPFLWNDNMRIGIFGQGNWHTYTYLKRGM